MFTGNGDDHDMFTSNDDNDDMFTSNDDDHDRFRIIQVDCLTKHLQWDASSSTPSHTICHHFKVKFFTTKYSLEDIAIFDDDYTRMVISMSFGNGEKNFFYWDDFPWMRRGFLCLACVAGRIIWEEAEIATSANDDHLNICFLAFSIFFG